ncbi:MAG: response regulator transcription factor [Nitrospinota bacterium]
MARILVVDDETKARKHLTAFLTAKGHEVKTARSGGEALDKLKTFRPQLVLLDVRMPGINGMEALEQMKQLNPDVRVIMVTAVDSIENVQHAIQTGADDYITKPVDLHYLQNSILVQHLDGAGDETEEAGKAVNAVDGCPTAAK